METMAEAMGQNPISMRALLEAGVHFGHNTGRWNPKMKQFIFGARNGIHIIDLQHTVKLFRQAFKAVVDTTSRGETVLFVGTKKQAQDVIVEEATRSGQHYVTQRWLGGTLTNFKTVKGSLERLRGLEKMEEDGTLFALTKREQVMIKRDRDKLMKSLGGIKGHEQGARHAVRDRSAQGAHRGRRGAQARDSGRRDHRHELRSRHDRLRHPGQRRRDPRDQAVRVEDRGRRDHRQQGLQGDRSSPWRRSEEDEGERVIHVSSGGDGPRVEMSTGGSMFNPEASASPDAE